MTSIDYTKPNISQIKSLNTNNRWCPIRGVTKVKLTGHALLRARQRCFKQYKKESWPVERLSQWLQRNASLALLKGEKHWRKNQEYKFNGIKYAIQSAKKNPKLITVF